VPTSRATRVTSSAKDESWSTMRLMVSASAATSPRASTVTFCVRSPLATAVVAWAIFLIVSIVMLTVVRPIAKAHLNTPPQIRTGTAALIGRRVMVVERIANDEAVGCVRIDGEIWTARAYDDEQIIEAGTPVHIVEIRGATALVSD